MTFATAIERFRQRQAAQFTQLATIRRPVGEPTTDTVTGEVTQTYETVGTDRPCKLTTGLAGGSDEVQAGETEGRIIGLLIKFPVGEDVQQWDEVTIDDGVYNLADIGRAYLVTMVNRREWQISRRSAVTEILLPPSNEEVGS